MKSSGPVLLFVIFAVVLAQYVSDSSAKPYTDIRKLPSITVDTLNEPIIEDSETSESVQFLRTFILGTQKFQHQIQPKQTEARYVTLFRLPWRIARSVSQTGFGMARGFMDAFTDQFIKSYQHMQQSVIPQASQTFSTWTTPPKPANLDTPWLDGGV